MSRIAWILLILSALPPHPQPSPGITEEISAFRQKVQASEDYDSGQKEKLLSLVDRELALSPGDAELQGLILTRAREGLGKVVDPVLMEAGLAKIRREINFSSGLIGKLPPLGKAPAGLRSRLVRMLEAGLDERALGRIRDALVGARKGRTDLPAALDLASYLYSRGRDPGQVAEITASVIQGRLAEAEARRQAESTQGAGHP